MAESTTTPIAEESTDSTTPQTAPMEQSGNGGNEPKTFTQEQVNRMIQERVARVKHEEPADYAELKAKAQADEWKAKFEALEAEQARMTSVQELATKYKVDAGTLSRMAGDVEDNAKYLAGLEAARPKYPGITDNGGNSSSPQTLEEALKGAKTFQEQIWVRAEWNKQHNK